MEHWVPYRPQLPDVHDRPQPPRGLASKARAWVTSKMGQRSSSGQNVPNSYMCLDCQALDLTSIIKRMIKGNDESSYSSNEKKIDTSNHVGLSSLENLRASAVRCEYCNIVYNAFIQHLANRRPDISGSAADRLAWTAIPVNVLFWARRRGPRLRYSVWSENLRAETEFAVLRGRTPFQIESLTDFNRQKSR